MTLAATYILVWALVILQGLVICALVHQVSELRRHIEAGVGIGSTALGLPAGSWAPTFVALDIRSGRRVHSSTLLGRRTVLLFLSPQCSMCQSIAADLAMSHDSLQGLAVYCRGSERGCSSLLARLPSEALALRQADEDLAASYRIRGNPGAVVIGADWKIEGFQFPSSGADVTRALTQRPETAFGDLALQSN